MVDVIVDVFATVPEGVIVDATVGAGGHASALLAAYPHLGLVGIDRDPAALSAAAATLAPFGDRVTLRHARFDRLTTVMSDLHVPRVSGVLFDLGVSSPQVDNAERGFSYRSIGPLDMRMDPTDATGEADSSARTAGDIVNGYSEPELVRILRDYGDERFAARVARAIVAARPIEHTGELAALVREAIPAPARRRGGHPAKRTFQAIRIEVNRELEILVEALDQAVELTAPEGRVAVLSYHSGEDRIVKARFRHHATGGCTCPPGLPCVCDAVQTVRLVKPPRVTPAPDELAGNRRAESARLRVVEKRRVG